MHRAATGTSKATAFLLFTLLMLPFGLLVHLSAELAGVGEGSYFLARHAYMLLAVAVGLPLLAAAGLGSGRNGLRSIVALLPDRGRSGRFFLLSIAVQFAIATGTQVGEGLVVPASAMPIILLSALLAACIGAAICATFFERLVAIMCAFVARIAPWRGQAPSISLRQFAPRRPAHAFAPSVLSRPPPRN